MGDDPFHQPHDKLFKLGFSDPATVAALLRNEIPPRIAAAVDWDELKLLPGSFIDPRFRAHESDPLFAAPLADREAWFYLLFEHPSDEDRLISLRLIRYMCAIWDQRLAEFPKDQRCVPT